MRNTRVMGKASVASGAVSVRLPAAAIIHGAPHHAFMTSQLPITCRLLASLVFAGALLPGAAHSQRIPQTIDNTNMWSLRGNMHPHARADFDRGAVDASMPMEGMKLVFQLTPEQQSSLETLLKEQLDPSSPNFHKWLTPEEYASRFGVSAGDMACAA